MSANFIFIEVRQYALTERLEELEGEYPVRLLGFLNECLNGFIVCIFFLQQADVLFKPFELLFLFVGIDVFDVLSMNMLQATDNLLIDFERKKFI
jgi:hypothetical protein